MSKHSAYAPPYLHDREQHFEWLADYLRHLVDRHGIAETPELWRLGRTHYEAMHAALHDGVDPETAFASVVE